MSTLSEEDKRAKAEVTVQAKIDAEGSEWATFGDGRLYQPPGHPLSQLMLHARPLRTMLIATILRSVAGCEDVTSTHDFNAPVMDLQPD